MAINKELDFCIMTHRSKRSMTMESLTKLFFTLLFFFVAFKKILDKVDKIRHVVRKEKGVRMCIFFVSAWYSYSQSPLFCRVTACDTEQHLVVVDLIKYNGSKLTRVYCASRKKWRYCCGGCSLTSASSIEPCLCFFFRWSSRQSLLHGILTSLIADCIATSWQAMYMFP